MGGWNTKTIPAQSPARCLQNVSLTNQNSSGIIVEHLIAYTIQRNLFYLKIIDKKYGRKISAANRQNSINIY